MSNERLQAGFRLGVKGIALGLCGLGERSTCSGSDWVRSSLNVALFLAPFYMGAVLFWGLKTGR